MGKKNYGKSVKTRLLNLMNETGYKYMYLLARYFNERLLYRVSVIQYKDNYFSEWLEGSDPDYHTAQELYYKLEKREDFMRSF